MTGQGVALTLDRPRRVFDSGELLSGQYAIETYDLGEIKAIELSVVWYTEGKGDEDLAVHFFDRVEPQTGPPVDPRQPRRFSTRLPNSPLSYDGAIIKICWCVRLRVFPQRGKELLVEEPFRLGSGIPALSVVKDSTRECRAP